MKMMREGRVIFPNIMYERHLSFQDELVKEFGGFTLYTGQGGWGGPNGKIIENIVIYDISLDIEEWTTWGRLRDLIVRMGKDLKQDAVYYRRPNGIVEIIELNEE